MCGKQNSKIAPSPSLPHSTHPAKPLRLYILYTLLLWLRILLYSTVYFHEERLSRDIDLLNLDLEVKIKT